MRLRVSPPYERVLEARACDSWRKHDGLHGLLFLAQRAAGCSKSSRADMENRVVCRSEAAPLKHARYLRYLNNAGILTALCKLA